MFKITPQTVTDMLAISGRLDASMLASNETKAHVLRRLRHDGGTFRGAGWIAQTLVSESSEADMAFSGEPPTAKVQAVIGSMWKDHGSTDKVFHFTTKETDSGRVTPVTILLLTDALRERLADEKARLAILSLAKIAAVACLQDAGFTLDADSSGIVVLFAPDADGTPEVVPAPAPKTRKARRSGK